MLKSQKPRRRETYRLEAVDGELLLFDPHSTRILYCNPTAALIWQLADGERTVAELVTLLQAAYPEAVDTLETDVEQALEAFIAQGALSLQ